MKWELNYCKNKSNIKIEQEKLWRWKLPHELFLIRQTTKIRNLLAFYQETIYLE